MLQKFAFALKNKTIEFFAEEEEEFDDNASVIDLSTTGLLQDELISDERVVVVKPDPPPPPPPDLISSVFADVSAFRAAYLQLQSAHSPLDPDALKSADRAAVSHLNRLSLLKRNPNSNPNPNLGFLEAQVQENQILLRTFENVFNSLQADIDGKDNEAARLRRRLKESETANLELAKRVRAWVDADVDRVLSVGLFDSVVKDFCRSCHRLCKRVVEAERYEVMSHICLRMFSGFGSDGFCCDGGGVDRRESLRQFVEHLTCGPLRSSNQGFAKFCEMKYQELVGEDVESSVLAKLGQVESVLGSLRPSNPLYRLFVDMASNTWMLHKLARAYDPKVEIFQVGAGEEFSMVYMESVGKGADSTSFGSTKMLRPKVGFTVVPGFKVGKTVIQCRVYLDSMKGVK